MKNVAAVIFVVAGFCTVSAFAESPLEACEEWAVKENVDAADKAEYIEDCVDELSATDADEAIDTEDSETDNYGAEEQYSEPEIEPEPENADGYEEY